MGVRVPTVHDYRATDSSITPIALLTTETLHHDLTLVGTTVVRVLNYCSDARAAFNGSVCVMSPWEGLWVFRGAMSRDDSRGGQLFGLPHGALIAAARETAMCSLTLA